MHIPERKIMLILIIFEAYALLVPFSFVNSYYMYIALQNACFKMQIIAFKRSGLKPSFRKERYQGAAWKLGILQPPQDTMMIYSDEIFR